MNTKFKKTVKIIAAALFLFALAINIKVTLDDPFQMVSVQALATTTGSDSGTEAASTCNDVCVSNLSYNCSFEAKDANGNFITVTCHFMKKKGM